MDELKNMKILNKKTIGYGIMAFIISSAVFISYFVIKDFSSIVNYVSIFLDKLLVALTPLIMAVILAYLFNKPVSFFEGFLKKIKGRRVLSIGILYIFILAVLASVVNFIVPRVQQSLVQLVYVDLPGYSAAITSNLQQSMDWLKSSNFSIDYSNIQNYVSKFTNISSSVLEWIMSFAKSLTQGVVNLVLAMILAFYILQNKEKLLNSISELVYLYGGSRIKYTVISEAKEIDSILRGYIAGMFTDAIIVSIFVTVGLRLIGHNYFFLMGVAIGTLNLIPYFGSLIGCTLACLLALFQGVSKSLYTLVILIIIQQLDGNIIQPRIIGDKVGLEPLWIITAVLVFGSYWGIPGMIIAVPFTAFIKAILNRVIDKKREKVKKCKAEA